MAHTSTKRLGSLGLAVAFCCFQLPGAAQGYKGPGPNLAATSTSWQGLATNAGNSPLNMPSGNLTPVAANIARPVAMPAADVVQDVAVSGRVLDETGEGLPGVTVVLQGTTRGTSTNANGEFTLPVPASGGTLVFSFIGYTTQQVPINNQSTINVTMQTDAKALQEVVVVGYGTQRKEDLTGSVTVVSEEDFQQGNITTPEQLIAGKVAGVQITSNSGAPGAGSRIRIRGGSSLNASNDPLVVIDGVPVDNASISGSANPLSMINPNDIETFNVLKDASATAIYGSRASNGVIIITTKKGRAGDKMRVSLSSQASLAEVTETVDVLTGDEYRAAVNQYALPGSRALLGNANTDWQDLIYQNAFTTDNNLSVSGSVNTLPYRVSIGHLDQEGVLKTSRVKRTTGSLSLNPSFLDDHLKINLNVKGSLAKNRFADEGAIGSAVTFDPTQPVYQEGNAFGGYFEWMEGSGINTLAPRNPLSMLEQRNDRSEVRRSIGNLQLDYKLHFLPDLRANLNLGYDVSKGEGSVTLPPTLASVYAQGGSISQYEQKKTNNLLDFYLNYAKDYATFGRVDLTGGYSYQKFNTEIPPFATVNFAGDTITQAPIPNEFTNVLISFFGRLNYTFRDRYLLTATIRRDGSSRFSPDNRWGTFPALALGWRINEEAFLKDVAAISELKLRLGYGVTGQQDIGPYYPYLPRYAFSNNEAQYQLGDQFYSTLRPAGYDENIKWEETETWNAGLDFGILNGRVSGSLDYYFKKTKDLLAEIQVPAGSNLTNRLFTNVGNLENRGVEAILNFAAISTERVRWDLSFNGTYNENEITNLSRVPDDGTSIGFRVGGIGGGVGNQIQINSVGFPRNAFYVYKQVYDQNGRPIERLYADLSQDGSFSDDDLYRYKSIDPKVFLGFSSQLAYDKWSLGFVLRANIGNYVYNNINAANAFYNNLDWPGYLLTIPTNVRETGFVGEQSERLFSDYFVENASFLRMDNLNLGYNFGSVLNDRINLRATATGQNLFVITKYSGLDPEVASGIDNNFYPRPRIYSLGLNIDFQ
ncbi:SusC/RagA family TonB-linked outer membrane protein [Pontibacter roseus]|uniref:SusC/RagA family TonB-linked outer membrane protein n=1 Tax=Pontibacter roseus TaxID=336989 RepID=UPI000380BBC1|nr:TonB-dependent receptor [Pontibacter roseus]